MFRVQVSIPRIFLIIVNPVGKVSHKVQHLNYVRYNDLVFKMTAEERSQR